MSATAAAPDDAGERNAEQQERSRFRHRGHVPVQDVVVLVAAARAARGAGLVPTDVIHNLPAAVVEPGPGDTELGLPGLILDQDPAR